MFRLTGIVLSAILFIASLGFKTLMLSEGDSSFLIGLVCLLVGFSYLPWLANPLFILGLVLLSLKKARLALVSSTGSAILAVTTFSIRKAPFNEAGNMADVVGYGPGFYLWLASISVLFLTSLSLTCAPKSQPAVTLPPPLPLSRQ